MTGGRSPNFEDDEAAFLAASAAAAAAVAAAVTAGAPLLSVAAGDLRAVSTAQTRTCVASWKSGLRLAELESAPSRGPFIAAGQSREVPFDVRARNAHCAGV